MKEVSVLSDAMVVPTIPVTDLDRARAFYVDVLGLTPIDESPFSVRLRCGAGTQVSIFKRGPVERGHTVAHFEVTDIKATIADLRSRGAVFEEYTEGPLVTTNGVAQIGPALGAWLRDPDGNVLGLREGPVPA
jgi:catechol 2,3-dioxygenase-like lactoylglutathione lyase family enzyme